MKSGVRWVATALLAIAPVFALAATDWSGAYAGAQAGINHTTAGNSISNENALDAGVLAGYNFRLAPMFVLGGNAFFEWNQSKGHNVSGAGPTFDVGTNVYGVDVLAGIPIAEGVWLPYIKVGYGWADFTGDANVGTQDAVRYGLGVEWRVAERIGVAFQYMYQKFGSEVSNWKNENFTAGVNFHF